MPSIMKTVSILCILCTKSLMATASNLVPPASVAAQYSLTTSTSLPFPSATQSAAEAQSFIISQWSPSKGKISNGVSDLAFVTDPFPNSPTPDTQPGTSTSGPVLQITYPQGSYSHGTGGAQWYTTWNTTDGSVFDSMLLSYELAFDAGFNWVQGGKLPGLRGGPALNGCSGGSQPNGTDCFSTRLMWRTGGAGEVYAYMLTPNNICSNQNIICNSDYGVSINRGAFTFPSGQWTRVTMLVQMNNPPNVANGNVVFYFNDVQAISVSNLQFRSGTDVNIGGLFFSTFFGGSDSSWATPQTTHTYFRNFQMWGSSSPSTLSGQKAGAATCTTGQFWKWVISTFFGAVLLFIT
ncbi:polysaccharide lyase family 14 protein [Hygrophoropsis aurantiaca]|uniref:Polysaccharide lyase family 14 protein n=1 Tax=Hygrophoropsis aurantiaca TaxID=72124 RepID=A0ACB8AII9_9AGAM|nr:polysaccharide lyase family 14 protein [Hygrophoropsis aurantiaca]